MKGNPSIEFPEVIELSRLHRGLKQLLEGNVKCVNGDDLTEKDIIVTLMPHPQKPFILIQPSNGRAN